jgi:hypothetical protein
MIDVKEKVGSSPLSFWLNTEINRKVYKLFLYWLSLIKIKKGSDVVVYERNGDTATGSIKDVVNNSVLILGKFQGGFDAQKRNCECGTGPTMVIRRFDEMGF